LNSLKYWSFFCSGIFNNALLLTLEYVLLYESHEFIEKLRFFCVVLFNNDLYVLIKY
jgi:hypothetical protein